MRALRKILCILSMASGLSISRMLVVLAIFAGRAYGQPSYQVLNGFEPKGLYDPRAPLIEASDGSFYGTTGQGGTSDRGGVFKIDAAGTLTTLHSFSSPDGSYLDAPLIEASDGSFYGTTLQ
ncbi:MAG: hypothetical protein HY721_04440, partial [Planctomycetes bacterium]|nr:hypothetical protein [Planctomycetota bacterium]